MSSKTFPEPVFPVVDNIPFPTQWNKVFLFPIFRETTKRQRRVTPEEDACVCVWATSNVCDDDDHQTDDGGSGWWVVGLQVFFFSVFEERQWVLCARPWRGKRDIVVEMYGKGMCEGTIKSRNHKISKKYKECKDLLKFFQITFVLVSRKVGFNREGNGKVAAAKYEGKIHWDKIYLKRTPHESFGISFTKFCVVCMCSKCVYVYVRDREVVRLVQRNANGEHKL